MIKTITAELYGGPFDGETVDAFPAPAVVTVFHDPITKRTECTPLQTPSHYEDWVVVGWYAWLEPHRLHWKPND